jgi:hypothetical protein
MTPRTPQCEVFWALLSNFKHSRVPEDSKSPTLEVLRFTPTLGQSGVATLKESHMVVVKAILPYLHHYPLIGLYKCFVEGEEDIFLGFFNANFAHDLDDKIFH